MKREDMLNVMREAYLNWQCGDINEYRDIYDCILTAIEKHGMLPPVQTELLGHLSITQATKWED